MSGLQTTLGVASFMFRSEPADVPNVYTAPPELAMAMQAHGVEFPFHKGQLLISSLSEHQDVFWIKMGKVQVTVLSPSGKETILSVLEEGHCFGEMAAIDDAPRYANVTASTDGIALRLTNSAFLEILRQSSDSALWLLRLYTRHIRDLTDRIYELSSYSVATRLHGEIMRMVMQTGVHDGMCILRHSPTHAEIAARIGTNRESVTRELGLLAELGILKQKGRNLTIFDVGALNLLVSEKRR